MKMGPILVGCRVIPVQRCGIARMKPVWTFDGPKINIKPIFDTAKI
jgi:hypothetical protein